MNARGKREELLELLGVLASKTIAPESHARLERILVEDAEARQTYFDYMDVHFGLHRWQLCDREAQPLDELREQLAGMPAEPPACVAPVAQRARYALVAAATLCVSLLLQFVVFPSKPSEVVPGSPHRGEYVATLGNTADCLWDGDDASLREGSRLLADELRLKKGVAEILFDSGAQWVIEGPAVLRIDSASAATLIQGKVVLKSDETAEAFLLQTPSSTLIDYGTEYAVSVGPSGEEVHVFDGEVRREPKPASKSAVRTEPEQLTAGNARQYGRLASTAGKPVPLGEERFVRQVPHRTGAPPDPTANLLAYEGFDYQTPAMSASGQSGGGIGWAQPWVVPNAAPMSLNTDESLVRQDAEESSIGGSIDYAGASQIQRQLATPIRLDQDGVYYFSFLFRRSAGSVKPPNTFMLMLSNPRQPEPQKRLSVGAAQPNHVVFANLEGGGARTALPLGYERTYLLVGKIVAGRKSPDQVFLRVYRPDEPVDRGEPASWSVASRPVQSDLVLDTLTIHVNSESRQAIDEIRLGTTWRSVTAPWSK